MQNHSCVGTNGASQETAGARIFLDPHLEHGETRGTAEATSGRYVCVHALLGGLKLALTTEPRGLTEATSRAADIFTIDALPGRGEALDV